MVESLKVLNPEDPYDGPIKVKDKATKLSINDIDETGEGEAKNGESMDEDGNSKSGGSGNVIKVADLNKFANRTHTCGELTSDNIGEKVVICGWLEFQRMGKFLILRDGYGQTQVLINEKTDGLKDQEQGITLESIIKVEGTVIPRPAATINPKMKTGHIEVEAESVEILNTAKKNLPFEVRKFNRAGERLRLTHRYIDLRYLRNISLIVFKLKYFFSIKDFLTCNTIYVYALKL